LSVRPGFSFSLRLGACVHKVKWTNDYSIDVDEHQAEEMRRI